MSKRAVVRRLAAVLIADAVGYSSRMTDDEMLTHHQFMSDMDSVFKPLIGSHSGQVVKTTGDGFLARFDSAVQAVECATAMQQQMKERLAALPPERRMPYRMGINAGDIIIEPEDVYGDDVNLARRLEEMATPGDVYITAAVLRYLRGKASVQVEDLGAHQFKSGAEAQQVYRIRIGGGTDPIAAPPTTRQYPPLPNRPAIAVLPFENLSGDPEQVFFSDGVTEDIIRELSRFRELHVISRNSSFRYRGKSVDMRQVGRELGVHYVVEGSIRRSGQQLRISVQLIESETGNNLWAEHYDRKVEDVFDVQDEVVRMIVATLPGQIAGAGARSARRKRPDGMSVYDYLLRGIEYKQTFDRSEEPKVRETFERAIKADPELAIAHTWLAELEMREWWRNLSAPAMDRALSLAKRGAMLDPTDGQCHRVLGYVCLYRREFDEAALQFERALKLNPNDSHTIVTKAWLLAYEGHPEQALEWAQRGLQLNTNHPDWYVSAFGMAHFCARNYAEAVVQLGRNFVSPDIWELMYMTASLAQLNRIDEARLQVERYTEQEPKRSMLAYARHEPYRHAEGLEHLLESLRKAGVKE
ncbi:MAG: adenylate/guanylate cyclase domain-containing protein [Dongiaceae bacterium]